MNIGSERVRQRRKQIGLSQQALADFALTTQDHVSRVENGKSELTANEIIAFSKALQVSPDWLLGIDANEPGDPLEYKVLSFFRQKSAEKKMAILEIVRLM